MKLYTSKAVAQWLDMTERNVRMLKSKNIIKEYKPGLYRLQEVTSDYINYLRNKNPEADGNLDYNEERAKLMKAKRENVEIELQLKRNEVHQTEDVESVMTNMLLKFKSRLMAIPAKLSPKLAKKNKSEEVFEMLKSAIDEALEELADYDTMFGDEKNG